MGPVKGTCVVCGAGHKITPLYEVVSQTKEPQKKRKICHHCANDLKLLEGIDEIDQARKKFHWDIPPFTKPP